MHQIDEQERTEKGREFCSLIRQDLRDRRDTIEKRRWIRSTYFEDAPRDLEEGEADIRLRVVTEKVEGFVPKLVNAFWQADPIVHVQRIQSEFDEDETDNNELFMNWLVDQGIDDFYATTEMWFRNTLIDGVSVLHTYYDYEERDTVITSHMKAWVMPGEIDDATGEPVQEARPKVPVEILFDEFGPFIQGPMARGILSVEAVEGGSPDPAAEVANWDGVAYKIAFAENHRVHEDVLVEFRQSDRTDEVILLTHRTIAVTDGVQVECIEFEDLIVPYRTQSLQKAPRVTRQHWKSLHEIKQLMDSGEWQLTDEDFKRLVAQSKGSKQEEIEENDSLKRQKDNVAGEYGKDQGPGARQDDEEIGIKPYVGERILIMEVYACDDVTGNRKSEMVYQIPYCLEKIVQAEYLEERWPHRRRPFAELHYLRISDRYYSIGMAELLAPIHVEVNAIINLVNEAQELINRPWFGYVPSTLQCDPEILETLKAGQGVPIGDPNGLVFPKFPQQPLANLSAMDSLLLFADRLTISPQSVGSNQTRNAPRTARGTLALLSEAGVKADIFITAAQRGGWRELIHQIHGLEASFGDEEKFYHVTGEARPRKITQQELAGRFMYRFSGNSVNTNREVMRSISQVRYATLAQDPLFMQDLEARQNLVKDFLRHFGEGTDVTKLTPRLPGESGMRSPLPARSAISMMKQGQQLAAHPLERHEEFIAAIDQLRMSKEFELLSPDAVKAIASNYAQHLAMMQQQMQQAGGPPQSGGAGNQVPTELGDMEGGVQ
jgi:hypothetical protein